MGSNKQRSSVFRYPTGNTFFAWRHTAKVQQSIPISFTAYEVPHTKPGTKPQEVYSEKTQSFELKHHQAHRKPHSPEKHSRAICRPYF